MESTDIDFFKECFRNISVREINDRINIYRILSHAKNRSEEDLKDELRKILNVTVNGREYSFFLSTDVLMRKYLYFYRVRKFKSEDYEAFDSKKLFPSMIKQQDAWWKPEKLSTKYGRLNRPNHSVLYVSSRPSDAIYETGCKTGDRFFLMVYKNLRQIRISQIHQVTYLNEFSELDNAKRILLHNFLLSEFTKHVPIGSEYLYRSSLAIYEQFFKSPLADGFAYPSVASNANRGFNMCFEIDNVLKNLKLLGVIVCELCDSQIGSEFLTIQFYDGFLNEKDEFDFYTSDSPEAKSKFDDFSFCREMAFGS